MPIAINIDVNKSYASGAPTISVEELEKKVQAYVNSLYVNIAISEEEQPSQHHHSLSFLRGICKADISDRQAIDEYLADKY